MTAMRLAGSIAWEIVPHHAAIVMLTL